MYLVLMILAILVCVLLGAIVLIQNPKGGGLTSNFSSSSQLMGVQKTGDFLEKGTWILAIALMVISLAINVSVKGGSSKNQIDSKTQKTMDNVDKNTPAAAPASGTTLPGSLGQPKQGK
jgi:preprotein translocase subunit SecG